MSNKGRRSILTVLVVCIMTIVLTGCDIRIGYSGNTSTKKMSASFYYYSGTKEASIKLEGGDMITFDYSINEKKGKIEAIFEDSSGNVIYSFEPNTSGEREIIIDIDDTYKLIVVSEQARGSYKFEWEEK